MPPPWAWQALNSSCAVAVLGRLIFECARGGERQVQVLLVQLDAEARIESALDHALAVHFEHPRRGESTHQRLAHLAGIDAGLGCEQQCFGHRFDVERDDDLVADLADLAGADVRRPA